MGKVSFIGAGPGDPRLLTLRGAELLGQADVVVYDEDVHADALDLAREGAERVRIARDAKPEANVPDLVARARAGSHVARLFYGDPFAFRGGAIELAGVRQARVDVEVVAGVIAPTAAAAYSGLALSRYEDVTPSVALAVVNEAEELHDWRKLSLATDTLALLTDVDNVLEITHTLTYYGRKPETPAALVRDVSLPSQKVVLDTLVGIRKHIAEFEPSSPDEQRMVLLVVGDSIAGREALRWFDTRPLSGKRVLVTRTADQGHATAAMLRERGAEPVLVPMIEIHPPADPAPVLRAARELTSYAWVAFTSENGVRAFFDVLAAQSLDARALGQSRVAVIGPGTAAALASRGVRADVVAKEFRGEGLAKAMLDALGAQAKGARVLVARAKEAREALPEALREAGCAVDVVAAYETVPAPRAVTERVRSLLESKRIDAVTFTSASTVHGFCDAVGGDAAQLLAKSGALVASIGPITTEAAAARDIKVDATATTYTLEGLLTALESAFTRRA